MQLYLTVECSDEAFVWIVLEGCELLFLTFYVFACLSWLFTIIVIIIITIIIIIIIIVLYFIGKPLGQVFGKNCPFGFLSVLF